MTVAGANRVYIVDDEPELRKFVRIVAERAGWSVTECGDGAALLRELSTETEPALVLLDILMPGMDGIETVHKLSSCAHPLKVVLMTGGSQAVQLAARYISEDSSLRVGETLSKPVTVKELQQVLSAPVTH